MDWQHKVYLARQKRQYANADIVEFESGRAVVVPRDIPLSEVNQYAQAQFERMKGL